MNEAFRTSPKSPSQSVPGTVVCGDGIVIVDADATYRYAIHPHIEGLFPRARFRVAKTNVDALRLTIADPPAMLMVANNDPDLSGLELAAIVRSQDNLQHVALVVTAERFTASELRSLYRAGVFRSLLWPPDELVLRNLVWSVFNGQVLALQHS